MQSTPSPQTIVIDIGAHKWSIGFANSKVPKHSISPLIAVCTSPLDMGGLVGKFSFDSNALKRAGNPAWKLHRPFSRGIIVNWDSFEKLMGYILLEYIFPDATDMNQVRNNLACCKIFVTQPIISPPRQLTRITNSLFKSFNVNAVSLQDTGVLGMYAVGRTTGIVVDIGQELTIITPIIDGSILKTAIGVLDIGGRDATSYLLTLVRMTGNKYFSHHEFSHRDTISKLKEKYSFVQPLESSTTSSSKTSTGSTDSNTELDSKSGSLDFESQKGPVKFFNKFTPLFKPHGVKKPISITLPSGKSVSLSTERYMCMEAFFDPLLIGLASTIYSSDSNVQKSGLPAVIAHSLDLCHPSKRQSLVSSIIVQGNSSSSPGFISRLYQELALILPQSLVPHIQLLRSIDPIEPVFFGAATQASLSDRVWITKEKWENLPHKKLINELAPSFSIDQLVSH